MRHYLKEITQGKITLLAVHATVSLLMPEDDSEYLSERRGGRTEQEKESVQNGIRTPCRQAKHGKMYCGLLKAGSMYLGLL